MMKLVLYCIFLIPLSFLTSYWLVQMFLFILCFLVFFNMSFNYLMANVSYCLGADLLSVTMIILSIWVCSLMMMASHKLFNLNYFFKFYVSLILGLLVSLLVIFSSLNIFMFYLFFEISLVPMLILIIGWGYQPDRIDAGVYLFFYTLIVSLPMMISLFYLYGNVGSLDFYFLKMVKIDNLMVYLSLILVFLVKIPMYGVHLWLPKAHVEAPVAGSMILAGVMLKLGGYGLMRFMVLFQGYLMNLNLFLIVNSLLGGVYISLVCLRQWDMKSLVAYSSVSHMSLVLSGILTLNTWGMWGALLLMVAHGLSSSGLFCLVNINYERIHSRSMFLNKGMISIIPSLSLWWFLFSACNMSAPPSLNLFGEIFLLSSLMSYSIYFMGGLMFMMFYSAVYSLYMYSYCNHGKIYSSLFSFNSVKVIEYLLLFLHWLPLNVLILKMEVFTLWV
uniref:NADH-ubiquinone oxidoreductase chain 4 n=1 Tax=Aspidiphorus orbiculatus TaxID=577441 RepID=A0A0S2M6N2_9CUCU|nr:NADH deshydrogenase subunit 4 [Aspidiphorus orbiculatus]